MGPAPFDAAGVGGAIPDHPGLRRRYAAQGHVADLPTDVGRSAFDLMPPLTGDDSYSFLSGES